MTKTPIVTLGDVATGDPLQLDLWKLLSTRLIVTASSGSGKSWLLRGLVEQCLPLVQTFVIDPEGEYGTLREKFDLLVAGEGGDLPAATDGAHLLARKLVESHVSAVIDLYEIAGEGDIWDSRRAFVADFFDALLNLPRDLRHPILIILDEAHWFAPQIGGGKAGGPEFRSGRAVKNIFGAGRKRGLCCCVATQRVTKLHNDVIAECKNVFIGGTNLLADQQRAGDMLGMNKADYLQLKQLEAGQFYAYGPALVTGRGHEARKGVALFKSGPVLTTHPSMGERRELSVPKASEAIKQLVAQMGDLPKQAKAEAHSIDELQKENARLKREMAARPVQVKAEFQTVVERVEVPVITDDQLQTIRALFGDTNRVVETALDSLQKRMQELNVQIGKVHAAAVPIARTVTAPRAVGQLARAPVRASPRATAAAPAEGVTTPQQRILDALAWLESVGVMQAQKTQLALLAEASPTSSGYSNNLGALRTGGLINYPAPGAVALTDIGRQAANQPETPPTTAALQATVLARLPRPKARILEVLIGAYPDSVDKAELAEQSGASATSSGYSNNLGSLRSLGLIDYPQPGRVVALPILFLEG